MRTLLDEIISNTRFGTAGDAPEVVSVQNDVTRINVGEGGGPGGTSLPSERLKQQIDAITNGGGWDEAEYGISREAQIAKLTESYNKAVAYERTPAGIEAARMEAERVLTEMRQRAIRRAGLDTTNGRVNLMVAGAAPWHRLGVLVKEATTSAHARTLAGLDWRVEKTPLQYLNPRTGLMEEAKDVFGIVRQDTGRMLGHVGNRYEVIQNDDGFDFLDNVIGEFGARYESAGSLGFGETVFMLVHLPKSGFTVLGTDRTEAYAMFTNCHDGTGSALVLPTDERVVCGNTRRRAITGAKDKTLRIRHTGRVADKIEAAREALGISVREFEKEKESAVAMTRTRTDPTEFANVVLDDVLELTRADQMKGADLWSAVMLATAVDQKQKERERFAKLQTERRSLLEDILARYETERNGKGNAAGTVWAAYNSVTEAADHGPLGGRRIGSEVKKEETRFASVLTGRADEVKQAAYTRAVALSA